MAHEYRNMSIFITDLDYGVLDLPFLPEELEIKFDGNDVTQYLANGQFYTHKKLPKPKEIEISCFFPGDATLNQVNKGVDYTNFMSPDEWREFFFNCMQESRTINICFTWWDFEMDCTVSYFNPKIQYAEVDDVYYTVKFLECADPYIRPLTTIRAQGHNSWITAGEWQLVGGQTMQTVNITPLIPQTQDQIAAATTNTAVEHKATVPTTDQKLIDMLKARDEQTRQLLNNKYGSSINTKDYLCKDGFVCITGNYEYLVNFSRKKEDINNPKYDILKDPKYGNDPFYTRGCKGDSSYNNIYNYIRNEGLFEIVQKIDYKSAYPIYSTTLYKIKLVDTHSTDGSNIFYVNADIIDTYLFKQKVKSKAITVW